MLWANMILAFSGLWKTRDTVTGCLALFTNYFFSFGILPSLLFMHMQCSCIWWRLLIFLCRHYPVLWWLPCVVATLIHIWQGHASESALDTVFQKAHTDLKDGMQGFYWAVSPDTYMSRNEGSGTGKRKKLKCCLVTINTTADHGDVLELGWLGSCLALR